MSTNQVDKDLIEQILIRNEQALRTVYNTHYKTIYLFISRQLTDKQLAEELTQDVFIDFLEGLRDFRFQCSIKTFLYSVARNKVIDTIRKKKLKKIMFSALPSYFVENLAKIVMDDEIEKKELAEKLKRVFEALPHDYSLVLRLKYIEELPVKQISEQLSLTFKATESLLFRARKAFVKLYNSSH